MAIYTKSKFHAAVIKSLCIPKQFEFLAIHFEFGKDCHLNLVGCYRQPLAGKEALSSFSCVLAYLPSKELILMEYGLSTKIRFRL